MEKEIVIIRRDLDGTNIKKGTYFKEDVEKHYPYLNFNDNYYFAIVKKEILEPGTKVFNGMHYYYVISLYNPSGKDYYGNFKLVPITEKTTGDFKLTYNVAPSMTSRDKDIRKMSDIKAAEVYWFINSSGSICSATKGENTKADKWRKMMGNMYPTMAEAQEVYYKLIERNS